MRKIPLELVGLLDASRVPSGCLVGAFWAPPGCFLGPIFASKTCLGGFKLGFWFAQQGSIYLFVVLIFVYVWRMNRLDKDYDVDEGE